MYGRADGMPSFQLTVAPARFTVTEVQGHRAFAHTVNCIRRSSTRSFLVGQTTVPFHSFLYRVFIESHEQGYGETCYRQVTSGKEKAGDNISELLLYPN
ncbi:hypothetical protein E4T38_06210 [Aureobasidium subglaciale]|nr:hypothetical protein E4T38_06210 [Aureobasidium subglaciale]KAI5219681.1 hypothetical protein E4T40_06333 [Aureobasidium subglaciale]KAI5223458.1 hypothetical protein E4T41_06173 [Aureobasidium subglaciale]KAI5260374.1 hypothetical protein E4T46_05965 [Aureobasidium subglaciale]